MGVDFIRARAKAFSKSWDAGRVELARKHLFSRSVENVLTGMVATCSEAGSFAPGDEVYVRTEGDRLLIVVDLAVRGEIVAPSLDVVDALQRAGGYASGKIVSSHPAQQLIEVAIQ